jgi:hypothetical protein
MMIHGRALRRFHIGAAQNRQHFVKGDAVAFPDSQFSDLEGVGLVKRGPPIPARLLSQFRLAASARAVESKSPVRRTRKKTAVNPA